MIIYNPENEELISQRMKEAEKILESLPYKHCFITGSFLYKKDYGDIDIFAITRKKGKKPILPDKRMNLTIIDFNDLYSLFFHSISKSCVSKNILPKRPLKVTVADYWNIINESIPNILNNKKDFRKSIRYLILYTEYFKNKRVLSSFELLKETAKFRDYSQALDYISSEASDAIPRELNPNYLRRYFYTQAGYYKGMLDYESQRMLYDLCHNIIKGAHG